MVAVTVANSTLYAGAAIVVIVAGLAVIFRRR